MTALVDYVVVDDVGIDIDAVVVLVCCIAKNVCVAVVVVGPVVVYVLAVVDGILDAFVVAAAVPYVVPDLMTCG